MPNGILRLVHLSDIHFAKPNRPDVYDPDLDLRREVQRDLRSLVERLGPMDGLIVTGDIAFSGREKEYQVMQEWLTTLADACRCSGSSIWTVPGNHDVDRSVARASKVLTMLHEKLRACELAGLDREITDLLNDRAAADQLWVPLESYNAFAAKYDCEISTGRPFWEYDLPLNDGSTLRLVGLNSVLVSNGFDDDGASKLVLGSYQVALSREDGRCYLTACHHPPSWLRDQNQVERQLVTRAAVSLFGHRHEAGATTVGAGHLRVSAGATMPAREERGWIPTYNILELKVEGTGEDRAMAVNLYSRVWNPNDTAFGPSTAGNLNPRVFRLALGPWNPPVPIGEPESPAKPPKEPRPMPPKQMKEAAPLPGGQETPIPVQDAHRELVYRFLSLPFVKQVALVQELKLLEEKDASLKGTQLLKRAFERASERNDLANLWASTMKASGQPLEPNPFAR